MTLDLDTAFHRVELLARHDPRQRIVAPGVVAWLREASQLDRFEDAFHRWLDSACVAWALEYATSTIPSAAEPAFVDRVRAAIRRNLVIETSAAASLRLDRLHAARAALALAAGDLAEAADASEWLHVVEPAPRPLGAWIRVECAARRGDVDGWLAAAEEGLATEGLPPALRGTLLDHRARALEASQRWVDALDARIAYCEQCEWDISSWLLVAYLRVLVADYDGAAQWIRRLAERDEQLIQRVSKAERLHVVARAVTDALERTGAVDDLRRFRAALDCASSSF